MIAPAVIDRIQKFLAEGRLSHRKIAQKMGVSRGTVASAADDRRPDYEQIRRKRAERRQPIPLGPLARCGECGGLVHVPCRLCQMRRKLANSPRRVPDRRPDEPLGLDLHDNVLARYETVHLQRMQQGEPCEEDETDPRDDLPSWLDEDEVDWT